MSQSEVDKVAGSLVGQMIEGRYQVQSLMPVSDREVEYYEGTQASLDRPVVVKVLHPGAADRADLAERFLREGRALARLDHPRIAHVLEVGVHGSRPFLVRDRIAGSTLESFFESGRTYSFEEARSLLVELLSAVDHLHRHGLVHRDLSASNIVIAEDGTPRIVDFQAVQVPKESDAPKLTGVGMVLGDPRYAAAEHLMGFPTDARSDLYSVGVLAYRLITGVLPFAGTTPAALIALQGRPARPIAELVSLPAEAKPIADLIEQMIAVSPDRRPQTAAEALSVLGAAPPVATKRLPPAEPVTESAVVLPPSVFKEQLEIWTDRMEDWKERAVELGVRQRSVWGPKWKALSRGTQIFVAGAAVGVVVASIAALASSSADEAVAAIEIAPPKVVAPPEDPIAQTMLKEARGHADKRRVEKALDAYSRAAERAPALFVDRDIQVVIGYLARRDWLTSSAEKILVRVGAPAVPQLRTLADDPKTNAFHRRRVEETLRALPEGPTR